MKKNKGIASLIVIGIAATILIIIGVTYLIQKPNEPATPEEKNTIDEKTDAIVENKDSAEKYSGEILAGNTSPFLDFKKSDYDIALQSDKLIVLYFYANWCPICRAEIPKTEAAFDELTTDQVIGFRVNYNDNETDSDEKSLAREFGVAYQHTKVFVKNKERILKSPEEWNKDRYLTEINSYINK